MIHWRTKNKIVGTSILGEVITVNLHARVINLNVGTRPVLRLLYNWRGRGRIAVGPNPVANYIRLIK